MKAVVTGASSGIGRAVAELLIEDGVEVVAASRATEKLADLGCQIQYCDVADPGSCAALIAAAEPNTLINVAGIAQFGSFTETDAKDQARHIEVNLLGPFYLCHAAIPWMLEAGGGHIVNVLSIAATHPFAGAAAYCASKAGLHMLTKSLAAEYRSQGIRFTSIIPGSTDTALWDAQSFQPNREDMLSPRAVAECIRDVVLSPADRSFDEIVLMPPKGIL